MSASFSITEFSLFDIDTPASAIIKIGVIEQELTTLQLFEYDVNMIIFDNLPLRLPGNMIIDDNLPRKLSGNIIMALEHDATQ